MFNIGPPPESAPKDFSVPDPVATEVTRNVGQKTATAFIWSTSEIWGGQLIQLFVFVVLARLLDPKSFGLAALLMVFINLFSFLAGQGLPDALVQKQKLDKIEVSTVFWLSLGVSLLLAALLAISASQIATWLRQPAFAPVLRLSSPILVLNALAAIQEAQFRRDLRFRPLAIRRTCGNLIGGCCGVALGLAGAGVYALVGLHAMAVLTGVVLLWTQSTWRPSLVFSSSALKKLLPYSSHSFGSSLLTLVNRRSDDLIVGSFLGPVALGFYTVAHRILLVVESTVTLVVQRVAFPTFSRLQTQPERMVAAFQRTTHAASLLGVGIFTALAVQAPILIPVLFGPRWRASIAPMQVLAVVGLIQNILFFNNVLCRSVGKPGYNTFFLGLNAFANVLGFLFFARQGILAVAMVLLVNTIILSPISFLILRRITGIKLLSYFRQFAPPFGAALLASLLTLATRVAWHSFHETWGFLLFSTFVFGFTYSTLLLVFDRKFILELMRFAMSAIPKRLQSNIFVSSLSRWSTLGRPVTERENTS